MADPALREQSAAELPRRLQAAVISPDFYEAIQRPNAALVTERIERVEAGGVRTRDGRCTSSTCWCWRPASGPTASCGRWRWSGADGVAPRRRSGPRGRRRTSSISIPGFPNLFMLNGPNGPVGNFSLIEVAELQFAYMHRSSSSFCARALPGDQRQRRSDAPLRRASACAAAKNTIWVTGCRSWYLDDRGIPAAGRGPSIASGRRWPRRSPRTTSSPSVTGRVAPNRRSAARNSAECSRTHRLGEWTSNFTATTYTQAGSCTATPRCRTTARPCFASSPSG